MLLHLKGENILLFIKFNNINQIVREFDVFLIK